MFDPRGPSLMEMARQALSSTDRGYDLLAPKFEYSPFRTPDEVLKPAMEAVGGRRSIDRALDMCCGNGVVARQLRSKCRRSVTGIDRSRGMIDEASTYLQGAPGSAKIHLRCGDVLEMDYRQRFDVATTFGSFGHILKPQQDRFARRVYRALKPGGRFIFVTSPMPSILSPRRWAYRVFNGLMHLRNAVLKPPFIMFYLTFTLERAREVLRRHGFELEVRRPYRDTIYPWLRLVIAHRS